MGKETATEELSPFEVAQELGKAAVAQMDKQIAMLKSELEQIQKREAEGAAALDLKKSVFEKYEEFISLKNSNDPKKRITSIGGKGAVNPKAGKEIKTEGSGGEVHKNAMPAGPSAPASKPNGVPKAPPPPQAPGAAPSMHKMDIPATPEKANGGPQPTAKMEIPATPEKANGGPQPTKKMEIPASKEKANGGPAPMSKGALSPVFQVGKPKIGGKDPSSRAMTADASYAAHQQAKNTMALPNTAKLPSVADHASRAAYLASHTAQGGHAAPKPNAGGIDLPPDDGAAPQIVTGAAQFGLAPAGKFGKKEMDAVKCPKCKNGMSSCSCYKSGKK